MTDSSGRHSGVARLFDLNDDALEQPVLGPSLDYIARVGREVRLKRKD